MVRRNALLEVANSPLAFGSARTKAETKYRTGVLWTKTYRTKYEEMNTRCALYQGEDETIEHLVLRCPGLVPALQKGATDLAGELWFSDEKGRVDDKCIEITKERLKNRWKLSRGN